MKRFFAAVCGLLCVCIPLSGCGSDDELFLMTSQERNFLKSEFDENYAHYEDELKVEKKAKTISVSGSVSSGFIGLRLIERDKNGNAAQAYEFTISEDLSETLSETIELEKKRSDNWLVVSDFDEETEGGFKVEVFG